MGQGAKEPLSITPALLLSCPFLSTPTPRYGGPMARTKVADSHHKASLGLAWALCLVSRPDIREVGEVTEVGEV